MVEPRRPTLQVDSSPAEPPGKPNSGLRLIAVHRNNRGFPGGSVVKNLSANVGDLGNGNPLQYSCLGNPMDGSLAGCNPWGRKRVRRDFVTEQQQSGEYKYILFIYLFLAALGLRCFAWTFSSCGKRGLLFIAGQRLLIAVASPVAEQGL